VSPPKDDDFTKSTNTVEESQNASTDENNSAEAKTEESTTPERPKIVLNQSTKRTSGLSLKSLKEKKAHQIKQMDVVVDDEDLPTDEFTKEAFFEAWNTFVAKTEAKREMNLASILNMDTPKLDGATINLTFPNETNKIELERNSYDILNFLRKTLNNYDINFNISVNEVLKAKFAYTPEEKYEKLKEKNPAIDFLRSTFDLDL
jgi:DNA polymerase-3 subunit gamma/tau